MRLYGIALSIVLALGCSRERSGPEGAAPTGPAVALPPAGAPAIERVKAWAGPGITVTSWPGGPIADLELFLLRKPEPNKGDPRAPRRLGVAVAPGAKMWLHGKAAMKAVLDRGIRDPQVLARAVALFLGNGAQVTTSVELVPAYVPAEEKALAKAPAITNDVLEVWGTCCQDESRPPRLMRTRLTLSNLTFEGMDASHLLKLEAAAKGPASAPASAPAAKAPAAPAPAPAKATPVKAPAK